ncbi:MAG: sugar ABC transporter ATP-binding protein [Alicyclobacillus sp.]|nr:sugar ABC transporter ATP-binding protein [Alicyclobacillus sp.]
MGPQPVLQIQNVSKTFPGVKALDRVRFELRAGEVHALIGENGAGKSTLIKILAGAEMPDPGCEIRLNGKPVDIKRPIDATRQGIAVIYQDLSLFPNLTVAENIVMGKEEGNGLARVRWREVYTTAKKAMLELGVQIDLSVQLEQLSVAKQQLVAIARALAFDSSIIIMDEPTSSLSEGEVENLYRVIAKLKQRGIAIVFVSHKLNELFAVADRFTVLRDGQYVGTYRKDELDEEKLIALMVGRKVQLVQRSVRELGEVVLRVNNLCKKGNYKDVSFALRSGEIVGLTGLVGAGRTELAQTLFGLNVQDSGTIEIAGQLVHIDSPAKAVSFGIAYIPESRQRQGLILEHSVGQNITITTWRRLKNRWGLISRRQEQALAKDYLDKLDIRPRMLDVPVSTLSGGNQQKVVVAKWLSTMPRVLIVDEPTNGIDIGAKAEIHRLLRDLAAEGVAILMISSELPEILNLSDRVLVMRRGRIVGELAAAEATQEKIMNLAFLGSGGEGSIREKVAAE